MATVKFNLRGKLGNAPQTIQLIFRHKKNKLSFSTGFKVLPKHWNDKTQTVRNVTDVANRDQINNYINDLRTETLRYVSEMTVGRIDIDVQDLRAYLIQYTNTETKPKEENDLLQFIDEFIEQSKNKTTNKGTKLSDNTIRVYNTFKTHLTDFNAKWTRRVTFKNIDYDFYFDYKDYLERKPLKANTVGKHIQVLKTVLNAATVRGVNTNLTYQQSFFKVIREESDNIYLTESELSELYELDLSDRPRLERVRDLFLVGAWTGLRFSDFSILSSRNIKDGFFDVTQTKTGDRVVIPIHSTVTAIMKKYGGELPKGISNQKMNDYIKEVCQVAEWTEYVQKKGTKGGVQLIERFKKWQLVSTHTARRSFATNLYKSGFPAIGIMQITGHKTEKAFLKYLKLTKNEHAKLLKMHWQTVQKSPLSVQK